MLSSFAGFARVAALGLLAAGPVVAQTPAARRVTLDEALAMAEGRSQQVAAAEAGVRRAEGQIDAAHSGRLPQLTSAVGYQRTLQTQFAGIFDSDAPPAEPCAGLTVNPGLPVEQRVAELERYLQCPAQNPFAGGGNDLPFGQRNIWTLNLQFQQLLYDGGQVSALERQARAGREAASVGVTTTRAQLGLDVATAFYDAALSDRVVAIAEAALSQAAETLRIIEAQFQQGDIAEFEVLRARVARDGQRASVARAGVSRDLAHLRLKQLLGLPADQPLELDANLNEPTGALASRWSNALAQAESSLSLVDRTALRQVEAGVEANEAALSAARAAFKPQVALTSAFTAYAYDIAPAFNRRDWTVGAGVSLPILDGGRRKANRAIAEATLEESRQQFELARELAELDTRSAHATYRAARAAWEATSGTVEQAERAYRIAEVRYREGLSTQLELNDARLALERAGVERAQAARDLQVARSRLALLPDLPLGAAASSAAGQAGGSGAAPQPQGAAAGAPSGAPMGTGSTTGMQTGAR